MKRFLTVIILLLSIFFAAEAGNVSLSKARAVAGNFFGGTRGLNITLLNASDVVSTRSGDEAPYYIFVNDGGGFIIVSGVEASDPILAYSRDGSFSLGDDMPEGLREWLEAVRATAVEIRLKGTEPTAAQKQLWSEALSVAPLKAAPAPTVDLDTPDWGQGDPWDTFCPEFDGKKSKVGCVAIAISEVMWYHAHREATIGRPAAGNGTVGGYHSSKNGCEVDIPVLDLSQETFDWTNMLRTYGKSATKVQKEAAARLCYDVAVMANMSFSPTGSSSATKNAVMKMPECFGYDAGYTYYDRSYLDDNAWISLLKEELDSERPVIIAGQSAAGAGHAFVIDGYDSSDRFLINWGWSGSSNGFYKAGRFSLYNASQTAFVGVKPDAGGSQDGRVYLARGTYGDKQYDGISFTGGNIYPGKSFTVKFGLLRNYCSETFSGQWGLLIKDSGGNVKQVANTGSLSLIVGGSGIGKSGVTVTLDNKLSIEKGDYLELNYTTSSNPSKADWKPAYYSLNPADSTCGRMALCLEDYVSMMCKSNGYLYFYFYPSSDWSYCQLYSGSGETWTEVSSDYFTVYSGSGAIQIKPALGKGHYKVVIKHGGTQSSGGVKNYYQTCEVEFTL